MRASVFYSFMVVSFVFFIRISRDQGGHSWRASKEQPQRCAKRAAFSNSLQFARWIVASRRRTRRRRQGSSSKNYYSGASGFNQHFPIAPISAVTRKFLSVSFRFSAQPSFSARLLFSQLKRCENPHFLSSGALFTAQTVLHSCRHMSNIQLCRK